MTLVLDASVVIAHILNERGPIEVFTRGEHLVIGTVNFSEVADFFARRGAVRQEVEALLATVAVEIHPLDRDLALDAAMMRPLTQSAGLSLGDRCCLALAQRLICTAVTTERSWAAVGSKLGIAVERVG